MTQKGGASFGEFTSAVFGPLSASDFAALHLSLLGVGWFSVKRP